MASSLFHWLPERLATGTCSFNSKETFLLKWGCRSIIIGIYKPFDGSLHKFERVWKNLANWHYARERTRTFWLTVWFRTIPLSLITMNNIGATETETFVTLEFVDHSSIFWIVSLHWAILKCVLDRYTACKILICSVQFECFFGSAEYVKLLN